MEKPRFDRDINWHIYDAITVIYFKIIGTDGNRGSKDNTRLAIKWQLIILAIVTWIFASLPFTFIFVWKFSIIKVKKIINVTHIYMKTMLLFWSFWFLIIRILPSPHLFSVGSSQALYSTPEETALQQKWFKDSLDFVTLFASWFVSRS